MNNSLKIKERYLVSTIRTFTIFMTVLMTLSGCSIVNSLRMMNANNGVIPKWSDETPQIVHIGTRYIGEKPYIKLVANNKQELLFLVDTGASFSMLFDTPAVKNLSFEKGFALSVAGWGEDDATPAYQTKLSNLSLGKITFDDVNLAYIAVSQSQYYHHQDEAIFDGVIGHDLMKHFVWTFDKANNQITISGEKKTVYQSDIILPFNTSLSKISIPATVHFNLDKSTTRDIVIDTGSRHYLKLNTAFLDNNLGSLPTKTIDAADFGMSGKAEHKRMTLPQVDIADLSISKVKANVIKSEDEDDWWIFGSALLNQFVTIIDYPNEEFVFRKYPNAKFKTKYNLAGLDLRKLRDGRLFVKYVFPDLPADKANVVAGSIIESINDVDSAMISEADWLRLVDKPSEINICFTNDKCIEVKTTEIEGYSVFR